MSGILLMRFGAAGGISYERTTFYINDTQAAGPQVHLEAGFSFMSDGRIRVTTENGNRNEYFNWFAPNSVGIGSKYWIKVLRTAGEANLSTGEGSLNLNTVYNLNANRYFCLGDSTPGVGYNYIDLDVPVYMNPSGTGIPMITYKFQLSYEWAP